MYLQKVWQGQVAGSYEWGDKPSGFTQCDKMQVPPKIIVFHDIIYVNIAVNVWNYANSDSLLKMWRERERAFEIIQKVL
jgi:hypothetical protein